MYHGSGTCAAKPGETVLGGTGHEVDSGVHTGASSTGGSCASSAASANKNDAREPACAYGMTGASLAQPDSS
jgi:type IV secretory pathway TrbL component